MDTFFSILTSKTRLMGWFALATTVSLCANDATRNLIQAENILYTELRNVKRYHGFNEFINTTEPTDAGFIKKYRRLSWSGSVKESNTVAYKGTQRTDFSGAALFTGATLTNSLIRSEYRNLNDPSYEGDGSGGPYIIQGFPGGGCAPLNTANLLTETVGQPGTTLASITQTTIVSALRRETSGSMGLLWSRIHFPCNLFDFQTGSDTFQSNGPVVEELSEPAEAVVVTDTKSAGYFVNPTARLTFRMENNSAWTPLATTPGIIEDIAYEGVAQFRLPGGSCGGKSYIMVVNLERRDGTLPAVTETKRYQVVANPSRSDLAEVEAAFSIKAEKLGQTVRVLSVVLEVDGPECGSCSSEPGASAGKLDSVNWSMNLGFLPGGLPAGMLQVRAETWGTALYTPASLLYAPPGLGNPAGATVLRANNTLRQIRTGVYLIDVITLAEDTSLSPSSYEIRFYTQAGSTPSAADPKLHVPAAAPLYTTRFSDPDGQGNRLLIRRFAAGQSEPVSTLEYGYIAATNTWTLVESGLRRTDKTVTPLNAAEDEVLTTIYDVTPVGLVKVSETKDKYRRYVLGGFTHRVLFQRTLDPTGAALVTNWDYMVDSRGMLRQTQVTRHDGTWEKNAYFISPGINGEITRIYNIYTPFVNSGPNDSVSQQRRIAEGEVSDVDFDADGKRDAHGERYELIGGIMSAVRSKRFSKLVTFDGQLCYAMETAQLIAPSFSPTDSALRWERRLTYAFGPFAGRTAYVRRPDLTIETVTYALDATTGHTTEVRSAGAPDAAQTTVVDGTRTTTITDVNGRLISSVSVDIASGLTIDSRTVLDRDAYGRPTAVLLTDGSLEESAYYPCCGLLESVKRHGLTTSFAYDDLGRKTSETSLGLTTLYTYDALDRVVRTVRRGSDASEIVTSQAAYDVAGRLVSQTDASGRITTFAEVYNADRTTTRTITLPGGATLIDQTNADGSPAARFGTQPAPSYHEYAIGSVGSITCIVDTEYKGEPGSAPAEWMKTYLNGLNQPLKVEYPDGAAAFSEYDPANRLSAQYDPDGVATLYAYNARGEQTVTAVDMNGNGVIDYAGTDRITRTTSDVTTRDGVTVNRVTTQIWETDGADTPVTVSVSEQSADGLRSWQTTRGLTTSTTTVLDGTGGRTVTTTAPDGTLTTQTYVSGRLSSQVTSHPSLGQLSATAFAYDTHGRLQTSTDARNGTTSYSYHNDDQLHTVTTPDPDTTQSGPGYDPQTTTYGYDAAGRQSTVTQPDGGVVTTEYYPTGQVKKTYGARTYPVEYTYDSQQRLKTLKTWQNFAGDTGAAVTTWNYDAARGLLQNKRYADNTGPGYTYWPSGRLRTRTWARGVTTNYSYNTAGDLTGIDYSDSTPDVTFAYDRAGRPRTRTDASGTCNWTYNTFGQLEDEAYTAGLLNGLSLDRSFDSLARLSSLSALSVSSVLNQTGYSYDAASRLDTVTQGVNTATYAYVPNSPLVGSVTFRNGGTTRLTTTKNYDQLNRLVSISSVPLGAPEPPGGGGSASSAVSASYLYNSANQRTKLTREDSRYWDYSYDSLGQVTGATKKLSDATPVPGHDYAYTFDDIGNRKTATANGQTSAYSANLLNQYDSRTVPAAFDVSGEARFDSTITLTVGSGLPQPVNRQGDLFFKQVSVDNSTLAVASDLKITGVKNLVGAAGEDAVTELTRLAFTPKTPEVFSHDLDGNLTSDGRWTYTWDGENRLIAVETSAAAVAAGAPKQKVELVFDGQTRRVAEKNYSWNAPTNAWVLTVSRRSIYDGFSLLAEVDDTGSPQRTFAWGVDLSGSLSGAGGVGGLLFTNTHGSGAQSTVPAYDGNGNIVGYIDASTGAVVARFEYSSFGQVLVADGPAAALMPFGFSTKYVCPVTRHQRYEFRDLDTENGRWLNRDPIEEEGSLNLSGFVGNDPISGIDPLGQFVLQFQAFIPGSKGISLPGVAGTWISGPETDVRLFIKGGLRLTPTISDFYYVQTDNREFSGTGSATSRLKAVSRDIRPRDVGSLQQIFGNDVFTPGGDPSIRTHGPNYAANIEAKTVNRNIRQRVRDLGGCKSEIRVDVWGHYGFITRPPGPDINFTAIWTLTRDGDGVKIELRGVHNKFPAYEGMVDGESLYQFYPPDPGPTMSNLTATQSFRASNPATR
jgi:RHS repeat-associated protein